MTLDEARANIDHGVVYTPAGGDPEDGVITGVSRTMVFVRYAGDQGAKATRPEDLTLLTRSFAERQADVAARMAEGEGCD